jgi:hypothetical protein
MRRLLYCLAFLFASSALAYQPLPPSTAVDAEELTITGKRLTWEDKIVVTQFGIPDGRPYQVIQTILFTVRPEGHLVGKIRDTKPETLARLLREKAAALGADAIIRTRFEQFSGLGSSYTLVSGVAIRVNIGGEFGVPLEDPVPVAQRKTEAKTPAPLAPEEPGGPILCTEFGTPSPY